LLDSYLTEAELAAELGLKPRSLWRWRREKRGPNPIMVGNKVLYAIESVHAWLKKHEQVMVRDKWHRATSGGRRNWKPEDRMRREKRRKATTT
jgi:predicted DNA-binding transcriptional regulator AlpA